MRLVQRGHPNEAHDLSPSVVAPDGNLTGAAAVDVVRPAGFGRHGDGHRLAADLHSIALDERVDRERAAGLTLAEQAVAAVNEHRIREELLANRAARAS